MKTRAEFVPYPYVADIPSEGLRDLPRAICPIPIHIVDSPAQVAPMVSRLRSAGIIGIDTETRPSFVPGKSNRVALIQLSTMDECYLVRTCRLGLPQVLRELLEDESVLKVGLSLSGDYTDMRRLSPFEAGSFVELQRLCPGYGIRAASLQKMYAILFGEYMSKSQRMSNWEARTLTPAQQSYAALDAWACLRIYQLMMTQPVPHPAQFALL